MTDLLFRQICDLFCHRGQLQILLSNLPQDGNCFESEVGRDFGADDFRLIRPILRTDANRKGD
jgi:hypothetical protein